jgi:2-phospho-L-lactate guanylyltransferase
MPIWAIVPVKPFKRAKSRLAGLLSPEARINLSRRLLLHTLDVLARTPAISRTLVISRDPNVLALARRHRALTMTESGTGLLDLNVALRRSTHVARAFGASAVLVLPSDLPLLSPDDVGHLIEAIGLGPEVVIAPDRHESGTNALYVRPPGLLDYAFGEGSFQAHLAQARAARVEPNVCRRPNIALDLDTPEDLRLSEGARGVT